MCTYSLDKKPGDGGDGGGGDGGTGGGDGGGGGGGSGRSQTHNVQLSLLPDDCAPFG